MRLRLSTLAVCLCLAGTPVAATPRTRLTWYGHSAFRLVTPTGHVLLIDPWITNPTNPHGKEDLAGLESVDLILISHGHADHVGDSLDIARRTNAQVVTSFDQAQAYLRYLGFAPDRMGYDSVGNVGGTLSFFDGEVRVTLVNAVHGSSLSYKDKGEVRVEPAGNAVGFVIAVRGGPTIYHTGDTDVFGDMQLLRSMKVSLMLACIGDHFVMGPERAAEAVALVQPVKVAAMHYGTVRFLPGTPAQFATALGARDLLNRYQSLQIGQTLEL
ncbi:MAG TPA: metal-dependent hydrolase [Myxococcaceae bacterium]|nr:metal-dependent hydrolase [Myxococcaceae bacterium]